MEKELRIQLREYVNNSQNKLLIRTMIIQTYN